MNAAVVYRYVGLCLLLDAAFMLLSCFVSFTYGVDSAFYPFLQSFIITAIVGVFPLVFVPKKSFVSVKEGFLIVVFAWICSCLFGMLPYVLYSSDFGFADALFESTSGFTSTGASIISDIESLPPSILFWRSSTLWIGGIGVVMFALLVVPSMGGSKTKLAYVEISSMAKDNYKFTSSNLWRIVLIIYVSLTIVTGIALYIAGMNVFDAINHALSAASTGGFSTKNNSLMWWNNPAIETIIAISILISGTHLGLLYMTITGKKNLFKNDVWRFFISVMIVCGLLVSYNLYNTHTYTTIADSLRYGFFQVISYISSAGFASADNTLWPSTSELILIILSMGCAMAGSTSGGLKVDRILILIKAIRQRITLLKHPNAVLSLKLGGHAQDKSVVSGVLVMIGLYLLSIVFSTLFLTLYDYDLMTSFSASVSMLGNIGVGVGPVSNVQSLSFFPDSIKYWFSFMMLFGRMELFGLINIFFISTWK